MGSDLSVFAIKRQSRQAGAKPLVWRQGRRMSNALSICGMTYYVALVGGKVEVWCTMGGYKSPAGLAELGRPCKLEA